MKIQEIDRTELKNIQAAAGARGEEAKQARVALGSQLANLPEGKVLEFAPENDKETYRGMRMRVTRAAKEAGLTDVQSGKHTSGNLLVWRDASTTKNTRSKNGKADAAKAESPQPVGASA